MKKEEKELIVCFTISLLSTKLYSWWWYKLNWWKIRNKMKVYQDLIFISQFIFSLSPYYSQYNHNEYAACILRNLYFEEYNFCTIVF